MDSQAETQRHVKRVVDAARQVSVLTDYDPPMPTYDSAERAMAGDARALKQQLETLYLVSQHAQGKHPPAMPAYAQQSVKQLQDAPVEAAPTPAVQAASDLGTAVEGVADEIGISLENIKA